MKSKFIAMAAAAVATASAANAADLGRPVAAAVDYVKVCTAYGAGFFYIPGSDTCLKIGGRVYYDLRTGSGVFSRLNHQNSVYDTNRARTGNNFFTRVATYVNFDARSNTDFGLLRAYIDTRLRFSTGDASTTDIAINNGYIQWGGLTAGHARSFFDFTNAGYTYAPDYNAFQTNNLVNEIGYTFAFGNGLTATIGLIDSTAADSTVDTLLRNETTGAYGGNKTPDVVANLALTQAWGSAMIAAALHQDYSLANGSKEGFAVQGGVEVLLPMLAKGDKVALQAGYSQGAIGYITNNGTATGNLKKVYLPGNYIGEDWAIDANGTIQQDKLWGGIVSFKHVFNPNFEFNVDANFLNVNGYQARDMTLYGVGGNVVWYPTGKSNFSIGFDLSYGVLNYTSATKAANTTLNSGRGLANEQGWEGMMRINRTF